MSKIYDMYLNLKEENKDILYLFKCGKFYIFIDEDCEKINNYVVLKKVPFTKDKLKCDIRKFFYSIDKQILYKILKKHISDKKLLNFTKIILGNEKELGIPIGNYTS